MAFGLDLKDTEKRNKESKKATARAERIAKDRDRRAKLNSFNRGLSIVSLVALIILIFSIVSNLLGNNESFSFAKFLEVLQTAPHIDMSRMDKLFLPSTIDSDWGFFNFLRNFINDKIITPSNALTTIVVFLGELGRNVGEFFSWVLSVLF